MFDVSFTELLIIGIVALIVIGPEKLPKVARTVGHLLGRAQRYVNDVKRDIRQEMDAADGLNSLSNLKKEMEDAANSVKTSIHETTQSLRNPLEEAQEAMRKAEASVNESLAKLPSSPYEDAAALPDADAATVKPAAAQAELALSQGSAVPDAVTKSGTEAIITEPIAPAPAPANATPEATSPAPAAHPTTDTATVNPVPASAVPTSPVPDAADATPNTAPPEVKP